MEILITIIKHNTNYNTNIQLYILLNNNNSISINSNKKSYLKIEGAEKVITIQIPLKII